MKNILNRREKYMRMLEKKNRVYLTNRKRQWISNTLLKPKSSIQFPPSSLSNFKRNINKSYQRILIIPVIFYKTKHKKYDK